MKLELRAPRRARKRARRALTPDPDGLALLTGPDGRGFAQAAVAHRGGTLLGAHLDHIDHQLAGGTTVLYSCDVGWPDARRLEVVGLTWRGSGLNASDMDAEVFHDRDHEVAAWIYPGDPDLPGLARATVADAVVALLKEHRLIDASVGASRVELSMVSYRPRCRAVVRAVITPSVNGARSRRVFYLKAFTADDAPRARHRLELLSQVGLPVARLLAVTSDHLFVLESLPGEPMARHLCDRDAEARGEEMLALLDALPADLSTLPGRPAWADAVTHYADVLDAQQPEVGERAHRIAESVSGSLKGIAEGREPTHGDFHEGQLYLASGRISGVLDIEAAGPGRRVDDLACMIAHLSAVRQVDDAHSTGVGALIDGLLTVFDRRVDPVELRIRAAGVAVSLASGPYQEQDPHWRDQTNAILDAADRLLGMADGV